LDSPPLYGVTTPRQEQELMDLMRQSNVPAWWHAHEETLADWFVPFMELEDAATEIWCYDPLRVPDLLQAPDYAGAIARLEDPQVPADEIDTKLSLIRERQQRT
jgi:hypothetical protein